MNEKIPGLPYECLGQFGHVHQPLFRMVVVFNGKVYQGEGSSKKSAKIDAAQNAANDWFKVWDNLTMPLTMAVLMTWAMLVTFAFEDVDDVRFVDDDVHFVDDDNLST